MGKLTIEIDSQAPWTEWHALFRRIEQHAADHYARLEQGEVRPMPVKQPPEVRNLWAHLMGQGEQ